MKAVPSDYEVPEMEQKDIPDGKYKVKGIRWFTLNDDKKPMLVEFGGTLVGRLAFVMVDDKEGPNMSLTLGEMALLTMAFDVDTEVLGGQPEENEAGKISDYMQKVATLIDTSGQEVEVESRGSWVNDLPIDLKGTLGFRLIGFFSKDVVDDVPAPSQGEFGNKWFGLNFEVVAGAGGQSTPYKGAPFSEILSYAIDTTEDGPDFQRIEGSDKWTSSSYRLTNVMRLTAPNWVAEWDNNAKYKFQDPSNLLPEWLAAALSEDKVIEAYRGTDERNQRVKVNWADAKNITLGAVQSKPTAQPQQPDNSKVGLTVIAMLNCLAAGDAWEDAGTFKLSADGKKAAKQYLGPLKEDGVIPGQFKEWDADILAAVFELLIKKTRGDRREQLSKIWFDSFGVPETETKEEDDF